MQKIKIKNIDNIIDSKIKTYSKFLPELDESLNNELLKIKPLLQTGVLTKDSYEIFRNQHEKFHLNMHLSCFRDLYIHEYGFFMVSEDFLEKSVKFFSKSHILEVGAGTGFLSACLQSYGINITPTDSHTVDNSYGFSKLHTNVIQTDSVKYLAQNKNSFDTILMSWPDYGSDFAYEILKNMNKGQTLIYIGESCGGCTANDNFFESLHELAELIDFETREFKEKSFSWFGIHDKVNIYKIK